MTGGAIYIDIELHRVGAFSPFSFPSIPPVTSNINVAASQASSSVNERALSRRHKDRRSNRHCDTELDIPSEVRASNSFFAIVDECYVGLVQA